MTTHRVVLTVLATALVLAAGPGAVQAKTETDSQGAVKATFSYTAGKDRIQFKNLKVRILRDGVPVLTTTLPRYKGFAPGGRGEGSSIEVRDLDADREPEVIVSLFSGGANCCFTSLFYRYRPATNTYVPVRGNFGRFGYRLRNLARGGPLEIVATDVRFEGAFGLPSVVSVSPIRIFQLEKGYLADATRGFPGQVRRDLRSLRSTYREFVRAKANRKSILAAIAADQLILDDRDGVVRTFRRIELLYGKEFSGRLKKFLARRGYRLR